MSVEQPQCLIMKELEPSRAAAIARLQRFVPHAGRRYREERNYDRGAGRHRSVSGLSPYLRHRLIGEEEVLAAVLARHSRSAADKFVQEVFWRGYWKGWLEQHPSVWQDYLEALAACTRSLPGDAALERRYQEATAGATGIVPFDSWARELVRTGYLHNHARMWFASIWIFTLKLPWVLGADFFLRNLLDGDPASNTLSWRWVAGLHTRGKTYLATENNILRYAAERFRMEQQDLGLERLAGNAPPIEASDHPPATPVAWPARCEPASCSGVLLTEEDLRLRFPIEPGSFAALHVEAGFHPSDRVCSFRTGALQDALARAASEFPEVDVRSAPLSAQEIVDWARQSGLAQVWVAHAPVGYVQRRLHALEAELGGVGIQLIRFVREYDRLVWPHCGKGFFQLSKRIPELLNVLVDGGAEMTHPAPGEA